MVHPRKTFRLARFIKYALALLACVVFTLQISSHIVSFRAVVRTRARILQLGTSGGNLRAVYTAYPKPEVLDSAYSVWWDNDSHRFFSFNLTPPHLTLSDYMVEPATESETAESIDPNILVTDWKTAGFHRLVYAIVPGDFPDDKVPQSLTELDTWWLTPFWLLPLLAAVRRHHRNHTLRASSRAFCSIVFTSAASASLLIAIAVAVFWFRDISRLESLKFTNYFSASPFECRTFTTGSYPGLFQFGIFTQSDGPTRTGLAYRSSTPKPRFRSFIDSEFGAAWYLKFHPLEIHSPFGFVKYQPHGVALICLRPWLLQILALVIPIGWLLLRLRKKHDLSSDHPLCPNCSYDLHAHGPGGRCPECGAQIPFPSPAPPFASPPSSD